MEEINCTQGEDFAFQPKWSLAILMVTSARLELYILQTEAVQ